MKLMVLRDTTVGMSIGPLEGFGAFVVALDIGGDFASEVSFGSESRKSKLGCNGFEG